MQSFGNSGIFANEDALREDWTPTELPERDDELEAIHNALAPASRGTTAHNLFLYGKTGQGKTVAVKHKTTQLEEWATDTGEIDLEVIWLSCNNITSSYGCATKLVEKLSGKNPNGHDQQTVFDKLYAELDSIGGSIIIVLDEIDNLGQSDDLLYALPRARSTEKLTDARVSVIGISNDFNYVSNLSPKVKGTLCEKEVEFTPYNATQLRSILGRRVEIAFQDGVVTEAAIGLAAAYAAQEKGSARQAIRLLYEAGETALTEGDDEVTETHVESAHSTLERERIVEGIRNVTPQDQVVLAAVTLLEAKGETPSRTKHIYEQYTGLCSQIDLNPLQQRSVRNHLQDLAMQGFVESERRQSGLQGGDYYVFRLNTTLEMTIDVLSEDSRFQEVGIADQLSRASKNQSR